MAPDPFFNSLTFIFKVRVLAFFLICKYLVNSERSKKYYYFHLIGSWTFASEWHHIKCSMTCLDLHFQDHEFWNVNISKVVRAGEKCSRMTLTEVDICHRMGQLRMLYSVTLNMTLNGATANVVRDNLFLHFQGHDFEMWISWNCES